MNCRHLLVLPLMLVILLLGACGTALPTVKPFKLDVQQGNVVTSKMLLQLRPGMTKSQVRFVMGTPLIQDSFHGNRWDYVYQLREGGKVKEQRRVILDFENELLKSVRGDVVPAGSEAAKAAAEPVNIGTRVVEPNAKPQDKSMLDRLKFWGKAEAAKPADSKADGAKQMDVPTELTPAGQAEQEENEAPKSILQVPVESMSLDTAAPVAAEPPVETPKPLANIEPASVIEPSTLVEPEAAPMPPVENLPSETLSEPVPYDSSSGMLFDKSLKAESLELLVPATESAPSAKPESKTGNLTPPPPKELPAEDSAGFFDRLLERIGF